MGSFGNWTNVGNILLSSSPHALLMEVQVLPKQRLLLFGKNYYILFNWHLKVRESLWEIRIYWCCNRIFQNSWKIYSSLTGIKASFEIYFIKKNFYTSDKGLWAMGYVFTRYFIWLVGRHGKTKLFSTVQEYFFWKKKHLKIQKKEYLQAL